MARPLRIEFPGAVYHVSSRGEGGSAIFLDKADRQCLLSVLAHGMQRFDAKVLAYCLLDDSFEMVIYTAQANLSRLMRHVNGVYTQAFNRRHSRTGPVLQGRFKSVLVDRDKNLLGACQYVESAAVREGPHDQFMGLVQLWRTCRSQRGAGVAGQPWLVELRAGT